MAGPGENGLLRPVKVEGQFEAWQLASQLRQPVGLLGRTVRALEKSLLPAHVFPVLDPGGRQFCSLVEGHQFLEKNIERGAVKRDVMGVHQQQMSRWSQLHDLSPDQRRLVKGKGPDEGA